MPHPDNNSTAIPNIDRLQEIFARFPEILAVYLFGSTAEGRSNHQSDLDLAIVPSSADLKKKKLEILHQLTKAGFDNIDLVFIDTKDIVLRYEAIRSNCIVYQTEEFDRGEMYSRVVREYLDFLPYLKVQREAYKRRLLNGQT